MLPGPSLFYLVHGLQDSLHDGIIMHCYHEINYACIKIV